MTTRVIGFRQPDPTPSVSSARSQISGFSTDDDEDWRASETEDTSACLDKTKEQSAPEAKTNPARPEPEPSLLTPDMKTLEVDDDDDDDDAVDFNDEESGVDDSCFDEVEMEPTPVQPYRQPAHTESIIENQTASQPALPPQASTQFTASTGSLPPLKHEEIPALIKRNMKESLKIQELIKRINRLELENQQLRTDTQMRIDPWDEDIETAIDGPRRFPALGTPIHPSEIMMLVGELLSDCSLDWACDRLIKLAERSTFKPRKNKEAGIDPDFRENISLRPRVRLLERAVDDLLDKVAALEEGKAARASGSAEIPSKIGSDIDVDDQEEDLKERIKDLEGVVDVAQWRVDVVEYNLEGGDTKMDSTTFAQGTRVTKDDGSDAETVMEEA